MLTESHLQIALGASILALAVGPAFLVLSQKRDSVLAFLRGFVQVAVVGMVLLEVMPATVGAAGPTALAMLVLGYLLPGLLERKQAGDSRLTQVLVLVGLSVHAFADGLALVGAQAHGAAESLHGHGHGHGLEAAIVLHRIPVGLAIFWMMQSRGKTAGLLVCMMPIYLPLADSSGGITSLTTKPSCLAMAAQAAPMTYDCSREPETHIPSSTCTYAAPRSDPISMSP